MIKWFSGQSLVMPVGLWMPEMLWERSSMPGNKKTLLFRICDRKCNVINNMSRYVENAEFTRTIYSLK